MSLTDYYDFLNKFEMVIHVGAHPKGKNYHTYTYQWNKIALSKGTYIYEGENSSCIEDRTERDMKILHEFTQFVDQEKRWTRHQNEFTPEMKKICKEKIQEFVKKIKETFPNKHLRHLQMEALDLQSRL